MTQTDGKTEKTSRRHKNSQRENECSGLDEYGQNSSVDGANPFRFIAFYSSGENFFRSTPGDDRGEGTSGKILERLELIEDAYTSQVKEHQQQLENRLQQSRQQELGFRKAIQELKKDILTLISASEPPEVHNSGEDLNSNGND